MYSWGIKPEDIIPVSQNSISGEGIKILGAVFLRVSGYEKSGKFIEAPIMASVTDSTSRFYLSKQAMRQLGIIGPDFPALNASQAQEILGVTGSCGCL